MTGQVCSMKKIVAILFCLFAFVASARAEAFPAPDNVTWFSSGENPGEGKVKLYFFWSQSCPHCHEAKPYIDRMTAEFPWLELQSYEISQNRQDAGLYEMMARMMGEQAQYVPTFFYCGRAEHGYDKAETSGQALRGQLIACHDLLGKALAAQPAEVKKVEEAPKAMAPEPEAKPVAAEAAPEPVAAAPVPAEEKPAAPEVADDFPKAPTLAEMPALSMPAAPEKLVHIPLIGDIAPSSLSLPMLTVVLGGLDSVNPCAFFVLLFLLSVMVRAQSRWRMALVGGTFVFISGFVYFLFMSVWLTAFGIIDRLHAFEVVTTIAGIVAVVIGGLGIKEFYFFHKGPSLSIPDSAKPKLFHRMNDLVSADSMVAMLIGTATLAAVANSYELLCTAGLPMVFTQMLTQAHLASGTRYLYLVAYNIVYIVPLVVIVGVFSATMGARKLKESEGRILKLLSGVMMAGLGFTLVFRPEMLNNAGAAALLIAAAAVIVAVLAVIDRRVHGTHG